MSRIVTDGISRVGDEMVRAALYKAANVLLSRVTRFSAIKRWRLEVAKRSEDQGRGGSRMVTDGNSRVAPGL